MISFPKDFRDTLPLPESERELLLAALQNPSPVSIRINPFKLSMVLDLEKVSWCDQGYYLPKRPIFTFDPVFHSGGYYVQEASSMVIGEMVNQIRKNHEIKLALDLCASPGGKSTHLLSNLPSDSLLISNEVVSARLGALHENICRWGNANVAVTNNDPSHFSALENLFDLILVDAPCSGEGMFRKEEAALTEWSLKNVDMSCVRQKKILSDVLPSLKPGGFLIYSTCTYNEKENEENVKFFQENFNLEPVLLTVEGRNDFCFRFYPHLKKGEGFFVAVLRKMEEEHTTFRVKKNNVKKLNGIFQEFVQKENAEMVFFDFRDSVHFFPAVYFDLIETLKKQLRFTKIGTAVGMMKGQECIPDHELILSQHFEKKSMPEVKLNYEDAVNFLSKENISTLPENKGWGYFSYQNLPLGAYKSLQGRMNNYFPKDLKIRKKYENSMKFSLLPF